MTENALIGCSYWSGSIYEIDPTTGQAILIGPTGFTKTKSLACDNSRMLYSIVESSFGVPSALIRIDPQSGAGTFVTALTPQPTVNCLAFSSANQLFAATIGTNTAHTDGLATMNAVTGAETFIGDTQDGFDSLAFAPDGTLYEWGLRGLTTVDTATGVATPVNAAFGGGLFMQSLAFAPDGRLFSTDGNRLFTIDVHTGDNTLIGGNWEFPIGGGAYAGIDSITFLKPPPHKPLGQFTGDLIFQYVVSGQACGNLIIIGPRGIRIIPWGPGPSGSGEIVLSVAQRDRLVAAINEIASILRP